MNRRPTAHAATCATCRRSRSIRQRASDFDDAISAEAIRDETWRVWVHIADVSAYVRPDSPLDREARRPRTSVYVPGTVEPMLPTQLSGDACSLVAGRDGPR